MMNSSPIDLPTLRNHYTHFYINEKEIPILYRLKSNIYYPYVAFELVIDELRSFSSTWNSSEKLPLLPMTLNERTLYENLCPTVKFSSSSKLILCSLIDQFLQLVQFLKESQKNISIDEKNPQIFARFTIDIDFGSLQEIDILNCETTTKFNNLRSVHYPSIQTVKRQLSYDDDEKFDLSSIGGYLQLDRCIYPYLLLSSEIFLNLNDLRKPFSSTWENLLPYCCCQPMNVIENYMKIVSYGTRYIKKYKYYSKNIDNRFVSLNHLLLLHRPFLFVQLFHSDRTSLKNLHESYRNDFHDLLTKNLSHCGYFNQQPCIDGWSLFDSFDDEQIKSRLATSDEILLINWLLIYDHREIEVHHQMKHFILVKQPVALVKEKMKLIHHEHIRKRALFSQNPIQ